MKKNYLGLVSPDSNQLTHRELMLHSMLKRADLPEKLNWSKKAMYF